MNARLIKLLGSVTIIGILALGWLFVVSPYLEENGRLSEGLESAEAHQATLQSEIVRSKRYETAATEVQEYDILLSDKFPSAANADEIRTQIYNAANRNNVTVNVGTTVPAITQIELPTETTEPEQPVEDPADGTGEGIAEANQDAPPASEEPDLEPTPGDPSSGANIAEISISITADGTLSSLTKFLEEIADIDRSLLVNGVSISGSMGSGEEPEETYSLSIDSITYLYRDIPFPGTDTETDPDMEDFQEEPAPPTIEN